MVLAPSLLSKRNHICGKSGIALHGSVLARDSTDPTLANGKGGSQVALAQTQTQKKQGLLCSPTDSNKRLTHRLPLRRILPDCKRGLKRIRSQACSDFACPQPP